MTIASPRWRNVRLGVLTLLCVLIASIAGQVATFPNLVPWYASLSKPSFNPPNWIFAPVWTVLFALMAFSAWRILRLPRPTPGRRSALILFFTQLALNAGWSWAFFAAHDPLLGLIDIVPQSMIIVATALAFHRLDKLAARCLVPVAAWVAFATVLNIAIWRLNP